MCEVDDSQETQDLYHPRKFKLEHEYNAGAKCLKCGKCEGLDLHFWRKICKNCKCKQADHDLYEGHEYEMKRMLFQDSKVGHLRDYFDKLVAANDQPKTEFVKKFTWVPPGLNQGVMVKYMESLPPDRVPIVGKEGAKYRRAQMVYQLPIHDHDPSYCNSLEDEGQKAKMLQFCSDRNEYALGVGDVREKTQPTSKWNCQRCNEAVMAGDVAVFASRAGEDKCWHPGCFVCSECNHLLVDLIYFFKDGKIFCGRHYAEQCKPRCAACDELIFSDKYTLAENRNWHRHHFCCLECDRDLGDADSGSGGEPYVAKNGHPVCMGCYDKYYANRCGSCKKGIAADAERIDHEGLFWHATEECFHCTNCRKNMLGQQFLKDKSNNIFCSVDCARSCHK